MNWPDLTTPSRPVRRRATGTRRKSPGGPGDEVEVPRSNELTGSVMAGDQGKPHSVGPGGRVMKRYASDVAFTPAVKAIQVAKGSRTAYARMEWGSGWETTITPELEAFVSGLDMFYLGTANAQGQPYIQH